MSMIIFKCLKGNWLYKCFFCSSLQLHIDTQASTFLVLWDSTSISYIVIIHISIAANWYDWLWAPGKNYGFSKRLNTFFNVFFQWILLRLPPQVHQVHQVTCQSRIKRLSFCDSTKLLLETPSGLQVQEAGFFCWMKKQLQKQRIPRVHKGGCFQTKKPATIRQGKMWLPRRPVWGMNSFGFYKNTAYIIYCRNESNRFVLASKYVNWFCLKLIIMEQGLL